LRHSAQLNSVSDSPRGGGSDKCTISKRGRGLDKMYRRTAGCRPLR